MAMKLNNPLAAEVLDMQDIPATHVREYLVLALKASMKS
jgi:hypothetical protein